MDSSGWSDSKVGPFVIMTRTGGHRIRIHHPEVGLSLYTNKNKTLFVCEILVANQYSSSLLSEVSVK